MSAAPVKVDIKASLLMISDEFQLVALHGTPPDRYAFFMTVVDRAVCALGLEGETKDEVMVAFNRGWDEAKAERAKRRKA